LITLDAGGSRAAAAKAKAIAVVAMAEYINLLELENSPREVVDRERKSSRAAAARIINDNKTKRLCVKIVTP
jgi:hypothetical protein